MSDRSKLIERLTIHAAHHGNMTETRDAAQALREDQEELELLRTGAVYEKCQELIATIAAHEATIKELRATNIEQAKAIGDQVATIADRNELIAHLQERLDA